jgi:hypothetical protein
MSTVPGQRAALTEEMRARMEAERGVQKWRMSFTVVDGWSRYPLDLAVDSSMDWTAILELWYQRAVVTPGWEAQKYPRDPSVYVMKDADDNVVEHIDGKERVFAYYAPSLTGAVQPEAPKKKQTAAPQPTQEKLIGLQAIEMSSGDVVTLQNIASYDEAIPTVRKMANVPAEWTVTIIENKPTALMVDCAPPSYGPITVEKYNELQRHVASELSKVLKPRATSKAVMLNVTYVRLTPQRKEHKKTLRFRMEEDDDKQLVLTRWIDLVKNEAGPWDAIGRKMSVRAEDYNWNTGMENPLQFPWYDCEAISFHDPPRASTDIRPPDSNDPEPNDPPSGPDSGKPSFGPGSEDSSGSPDSNVAGTSAGSSSGIGGDTRGANGCARLYDTHDVRELRE